MEGGAGSKWLGVAPQNTRAEVILVIIVSEVHTLLGQVSPERVSELVTALDPVVAAEVQEAEVFAKLKRFHERQGERACAAGDEMVIVH